MAAARDAGDDYGASATPGWRDVDWQRHLHQVEIAGRRVNYADIGEGEDPAVVMIHGLGGCWQNWLENMPRVAQDRRVVALDLPGFGESEMPPEDISISGYGRVVDELIEKLELDRVVVVGNSMGGFIGAETAIQFPQRVERLVLVSPAGITTTKLKSQPLVTSQRALGVLVAYTAAQQRRLAARPRSRHFMLCWVARHPSRLKPDLVYEGMLQGTGKKGFIPALEALLSYDFTDRLPEIECETLIVWGREDMLLPVKDADEFERLIPKSRKVLMDDTAHVAMLERPEAFNECLLEFLAESSAAEPQPGAAAAS